MNSEETWIKPIAQTSLSRSVMNSIKQGIMEGRIKPGEYLPSEAELAEKFKVGKSSIREAIKMLEAIGYVEIIKGNGCRVRTSVDPEIINPLAFQLLLNEGCRDELLEFRKTVEITATKLAMQKANDTDYKKIATSIENLKKHYKNGRSTLNDDIEFHNLIYESTHNSYFIIIGKAVMGLFHSSLTISNKNHPEDVIIDHENIYKAIIEKDESAIEKAISESLKRWYIFSL